MPQLVLNVEDNQITRYIRTQVLTQAGFVVTEASTIRQALGALEEIPFKAVILDVNLPDGSGLDLCRKIKEQSDAQIVVIHVSSSQVGTKAQVTGLEGGADMYLCEPVEPELLIASVKAMLRLRKAEQERAESETRLRLVLDQMPAGVIIAEAPSGHLLYTNDQVERICGVQLETPPPGLRAALDTGATVTDQESEYVRPDGRTIILLNNIAPIRNPKGEIVAAVMTFLDITGRRVMEEALKHSNKALERFADTASHDLQEPLRTMITCTEFLAKNYSEQLDGSAKKMIDFSVAAGLRMSQLVQALLAYSRVGATPLNPEPVNLGSVVDHVMLNLHEALSESKGIVEFSKLPIVEADAGQITQLLQNLVGNAIKYRRDEEPPRITITAELVSEEWMITVADNGQGFDSNYADRIFGAFQRLHGRGVPGSGMGLAICKRIVENHGGRIWAESTLGAGSRFLFTLPLEPVHVEA